MLLRDARTVTAPHYSQLYVTGSGAAGGGLLARAHSRHAPGRNVGTCLELPVELVRGVRELMLLARGT